MSVMPQGVEHSTLPVSLDRPTAVSFGGPQALFAVVALGVATAAALLAGWAPLGFSIVTVFLFAGPHNWLELRYFLARLPGRWGRLRGFFLLSFAGILGLTLVFASLSFGIDSGVIERQAWDLIYPAWNTALLLWIASLVHW